MSQPFFHGTASEFSPGDLIEPGYELGARRGQGRVYVTTDPEVARNYGKFKAQARAALGETEARGHAYEVEPAGPVEPDPAVDSRFSPYRSRSPMRVIREITEPWEGTR